MSLTNDILFIFRKIQENTEQHAPVDIGDLTLSQIHCISVVGDVVDANVSRIASELAMTTGAITKMCTKLLQQGYVERYQSPGNQQKIYYRLTEEGQRVYHIHQRIHDKVYEDRRSVLSHYNEEEKLIILKFLNEMNEIMSDDNEAAAHQAEQK